MRISPGKNLWIVNCEDTKSWYVDNAFWTLIFLINAPFNGIQFFIFQQQK